MEKISIGPITRLNGSLWVNLELDQNKIVDAKLSVYEARNFENILSDRAPFDLSFIGQRVCSRCSVGNSVAAALAIESCNNINLTRRGKIVRAIIQGLDIISSHINSFYHIILPDYIDIAAILNYEGKDKKLIIVKEKIEALELKGDLAPLSMDKSGERIDHPETVLKLVNNYMDAYTICSRINKLIAVFTGKMPHPASIVPGGNTVSPGIDQIRELIFQLKDIAQWVDGVFLADTLNIAPSLINFGKIGLGSGNFLSFGGLAIDELGEDRFFPRGVILEKDLTTILNLELDKIIERTDYSWYSDDSGNRHPEDGRTVFDTDKKDAYSFVKAPRYRNRSMEVGALARLLIKGDRTLIKLAKDLSIGPSVLTRIISYAIETKSLIEVVFDWVSKLKPEGDAYVTKKSLPFAQGYGLTEASSGSVGYWVKVEDNRLVKTQIISPGTWNLSPKSRKTLGTIEDALIGLEITDKTNPIDVLRIVRSFAPCPTCASH